MAQNTASSTSAADLADIFFDTIADCACGQGWCDICSGWYPSAAGDCMSPKVPITTAITAAIAAGRLDRTHNAPWRDVALHLVLMARHAPGWDRARVTCWETDDLPYVIVSLPKADDRPNVSVELVAEESTRYVWPTIRLNAWSLRGEWQLKSGDYLLERLDWVSRLRLAPGRADELPVQWEEEVTIMSELFPWKAEYEDEEPTEAPAD